MHFWLVQNKPGLCAGGWSGTQLRTPYRNQPLSKACLSGIPDECGCQWCFTSRGITVLKLRDLGVVIKFTCSRRFRLQVQHRVDAAHFYVSRRCWGGSAVVSEASGYSLGRMSEKSSDVTWSSPLFCFHFLLRSPDTSGLVTLGYSACWELIFPLAPYRICSGPSRWTDRGSMEVSGCQQFAKPIMFIIGWV